MELLAAVLGARLAKFIEGEHNIKFTRRIFWSDSQNVLSWIRSDARNYKQFVALRISELMDLTEISEWQWVPTAENVADDATKWSCSPELDPTCRWFYGPPFLRLEEHDWPHDPKTIEGPNITELVCATTVRPTKLVPLTPDPVRCFSWARLRGAQAFVHRYIKNLRAKCAHETFKRSPLTSTELTASEAYLYRSSQREVFGAEMAVLQRDPPGIIDRKSSVYRYSPYLDEQGVMRMYGRIDVIEGVAIGVK